MFAIRSSVADYCVMCVAVAVAAAFVVIGWCCWSCCLVVLCCVLFVRCVCVLSLLPLLLLLSLLL